ncbi:Integrin alpha-PS2 [Orchesella cincta]|uniref:Integrin alpha-PS2 n=1 Tax=Orchesella cincta TaxID=48709 RepID=A0A1D2MPY4_ORCCI|nr:Integrin alpha-PS2 [Orchesella cincta]
MLPGLLQSVGSRPDIRWTKEGPSWDDDSYLGYSVAHGEFTGDRNSDVARLDAAWIQLDWQGELNYLELNSSKREILIIISMKTK